MLSFSIMIHQDKNRITEIEKSHTIF